MKSNSSSHSGSNIGKATAWSFAAEVAAKIVVPITNMVLARILAPSAFGIIATLNVVISFAEVFSIAGFQRYIVQHNFRSEGELNESATVAFWANLFIATLMWVVITVFRFPIVIAVGSAGYETPLIIAALILPINALSAVQETLFQRNLEYKILFIRRVTTSFLPFIVTVPLALLGFTYWALIIGTIVGGIVKVIILTISSEWKPALFFSFALLKSMFSFGLWTLLESFSMWASSYIDILIISNKMGDYFTGLYKTSQSTVTGLLSIITGATTSVLFVSLSRFQDDKNRFEEIFYRFQKSISIFVLPIGVGIFCFRITITEILLGHQWLEAAEFVGIWGLCTSFVCAFGTFCREVYRAKGKPNLSVIVQLLHLAFVIPVCIIYVRKGFDVFIYARSFAHLQIILLHFLFVKFKFDLSPKKMFLEVKEPLVCSTILGVCFFLILKRFTMPLAAQILCMVGFAIGYGSLLCLFTEYRRLLTDSIIKINNKLKLMALKNR